MLCASLDWMLEILRLTKSIRQRTYLKSQCAPSADVHTYRQPFLSNYEYQKGASASYMPKIRQRNSCGDDPSDCAASL